MDNAKKENEFVFHEKVPELTSLEEPKGASLVKGIGFDVADSEVRDFFIVETSVVLFNLSLVWLVR